MFFDIFCELCQQKGKSPNKAAEEIGLSNSITTKWKKTGATPGGDTLQRIATYFGVSTDYLLGKENKKAPTNSGERDIDMSEVDVAFYGEYKELTDDDQKTIRDMVRVMRERRAEKK